MAKSSHPKLITAHFLHLFLVVTVNTEGFECDADCVLDATVNVRQRRLVQWLHSLEHDVSRQEADCWHTIGSAAEREVLVYSNVENFAGWVNQVETLRIDAVLVLAGISICESP